MPSRAPRLMLVGAIRALATNSATTARVTVISPRETAMRGPAWMAGRGGASRVIASASSGGGPAGRRDRRHAVMWDRTEGRQCSQALHKSSSRTHAGFRTGEVEHSVTPDREYRS